MDIINVDLSNIEHEHICCSISEKKGENCVALKKAWLKERFKDGLVFKKLNARGKVFIEYIPAENAWYPILADNFLHINCFWVSGQFKGQGYANKLLEACILNAKHQNKHGLTVISSKKKMPFLSDPDYLKYKGFKLADTAQPYYELLYLPLTDNEHILNLPKFKDCAKNGTIKEREMVLYYSNQCPFAEKYAFIIRDIANAKGYPLLLNKIETKKQAQNSPMPFTTYSFFYEGKFITNEIFSEKKFEKFLLSMPVKNDL
ncbi:N-acetyltransferase [Desulfovibrio litoralis]|uniref:YoaP-like n=1 Tax=Desulfovibrio litoralis DSM 11393 TaxID=1121455 RepID=A0A1M7SX31_9BACT|nr:N-acetyltransferase [Desulfovibrio litoralis]SHN63032.1 YoaP-like [Desulfovibrio litoralis DSM 11393]